MNLFVDTSVWSLALRRDDEDPAPEVHLLIRALENGEAIYTTGLVLQELLQGIRGPRNRERILGRFAALPLLIPEREDHLAAAELRNECRRRGVQVGTIDVLLARLCLRHDLEMLATDQDFEAIARFCPLRVLKP